jgi:hypothetical protein
LQNSCSITNFTHFLPGKFWVIFQWDDARVGEHRE